MNARSLGESSRRAAIPGVTAATNPATQRALY